MKNIRNTKIMQNTKIMLDKRINSSTKKMRNTKKIPMIILILLMLISFSGCGKLDVIRDYSIKSFDKILTLSGDRVKTDESATSWSIYAPDQTARMVLSKDYSKSNLDVSIETDAKPFLKAGLDGTKLPKGMLVGDKIIVGTNLGETALSYEKEPTPLEIYKKIVSFSRDHLKYHAKLDHFGIDLTNGNVFEWAKNTATNDKDIVFLLNPQVFIDAGVDPNKVEGWLFAKVETMDSNGKKIQVDKFLKPFNLDSKPNKNSK